MKNPAVIAVLVVILSGLVFSRCKKQDNLPPTISGTINGEDIITDTLLVNAGSALELNLTFEDNEKLGEAKVSLTLEELPNYIQCYRASEYSDFQLYPLENANSSVDFISQVPDSVVGFYSLEIELIDLEGNRAQEDLVLSIENDHSISLDSIYFNQTIFSSCSTTLTEPDNSINVFATSVNPISTYALTGVQNGLEVFNLSAEGLNLTDLSQSIDFSVDTSTVDTIFTVLELKSVSGVSVWSDIILLP